MFLVSGPELVIASCTSGLIGSFPLANARTSEMLNEWFKTIKISLKGLKKNDPKAKVAPYCVNMNVHSSYKRFDEEKELISEYKPEIILTALGSPKRILETVHSYGGLVFADVNSIEYAKKAAAAGVDGLVLVTSGAGGHTGKMSPFAMIEEVKKFFNGVIILAGAISSGHSIAAAIALGADLVFMGTNFIPTKESLASEEYQQMLVKSEYEDLVLTDAITGVNCYFIKESLISAGCDLETLKRKEKIDFSTMEKHNEKTGSTMAWKNIWSAGHGIGSIEKISTVSDVAEKLKKEYLKASQRFTSMPW